MFPFRLSWVFRSRWMALLWAAGICWTVANFAAPEQPETNGAQAAPDGALDYNQADIAAIQDKLRSW